MTSISTASPRDNASDDSGLDAESLSAIRAILTEDDAPNASKGIAKGKADAAQQNTGASSPEAELSDAQPKEVAPLRRKADDLPPLNSPHVSEDVKPAPKKRGFSLRSKSKSRIKAMPAPIPSAAKSKPKLAQQTKTVSTASGIFDSIKAYRPTPAHIGLAAFVLLVLMRPWLVLGVVFLLAIILVGVFLILGYDGFWQNAMKAGRWYAKRNPDRAVALNKRLDRFAMRWDAILDRFPEGSVDGLYLPDFGELAMADQRHDEAVERRLSGLSG